MILSAGIRKIQSLWSHAGFRRYFANTAWLFAEKILRMVVGLFVGMWVARYLGPERYGLLSYAQSFVALFGAIATLGLDGIFVRELVKYPKKEDVLIGTALVLKEFGAFLVLIIIMIVMYFISDEKYVMIITFIVALSLPFESFKVFDMYFQSKVLSKYPVISNLLAFYITSFFKGFCIFVGASLKIFALLVPLEKIFSAFGYLYFYKKISVFGIRELRFQKRMAIELLKKSYPLAISGVAITANLKIDQVMIKEMVGLESVGYYAFAANMIGLLNMLPYIVTQSIFPYFVKIHKKNLKDFEDRLKKAYRCFIVASISICMFLFLEAKNIINLLGGEKYSGSIPIFKIGVFVLVCTSIASLNALYLKIVDLLKVYMSRHWINLFMNSFLNYFLIKSYGAVGAIWASLVSNIFTSIVCDFFDPRLKKINRIKIAVLKLR